MNRLGGVHRDMLKLLWSCAVGSHDFVYLILRREAHMTVVNAPTTQKSWLVTLLLCLFLGVLGVHRFYTGKIGTGIVQLLTIGGFFGIWVLVDLIMIAVGKFTDKDGQPLAR
jgi:hypothetical protein